MKLNLRKTHRNTSKLCQRELYCGSFLLDQKVIEQSLSFDEIMGVKLRSTACPQKIKLVNCWKNGKQFPTCKYNRKALSRVISIFQGLF